MPSGCGAVLNAARADSKVPPAGTKYLLGRVSYVTALNEMACAVERLPAVTESDGPKPCSSGGGTPGAAEAPPNAM